MMRIAGPVLLVVISTTTLHAAEENAPVLAPLQQRMLADAADGRFDSFSLLEAALIAGGADRGSDLGRYKLQLDEVAAHAKARIQPGAGLEEIAQIALETLHAKLLRGAYSAGCSRVQTTLDAGDYNCVTATVLFQALGEQIGLTAAAMAAPAHVYSRVTTDAPFDVETTCADWFAIDSAERRQLIGGGWRARLTTAPRAEGASPPAAFANLRELKSTQLVGKIYYNQGVALLAERKFAAAVKALQKSLLLDDQDGAARDNLLAAFNNWALDECEQQRYEQAAAILARGAAIDPDYQPFYTNDLHIHQKWAQHLCGRYEFAAAVEVLRLGGQRCPQAAVFQRGKFSVYRAWIGWLLESDRVAAAIEVLETLLDETTAPHAEKVALAELVARHVERLQAGGRHDLASLLLDGGAKHFILPREPAGDLTTPAL